MRWLRFPRLFIAARFAFDSNFLYFLILSLLRIALYISQRSVAIANKKRGAIGSIGLMQPLSVYTEGKKVATLVIKTDIVLMVKTYHS